MFGVAGHEVGASTYPTLAPAALQSLCERAGLQDVSRHTEQGLDLEGAPTLIIARRPAAASQSQSQPGKAHAQPWLIVQSGDDAFGPALAQELTRRGCEVELANVSEAAVWLERKNTQAQIVFVAPLVSLDAASGADVMHAQQGGALALASLVRELDAAGAAAQSRLCVVTRGGTPFGDDAGAASQPEQASLWGLGRVIANEYPALALRLNPHRTTLSSSAARGLIT